MKPKYVALLGGILMILGSFMPWMGLSNVFESITFTGVEQGLDGPLTIIVGVIVLVTALAAKEIPGQNHSLLAAICGMLGIGIALASYVGLLNLYPLLAAQGIQVSIGIGLVLIPIGAIVATVGGYQHNPGLMTESATPLVALESRMDVWKNAVTRPVVATFEAIARDPNATSRKAYNWIFVASLIGAVVQVVGIQLAANGLSAGALPVGAFLGTTSVCTVLLVPFFAVLGLAIDAGITNWLARRLGGSGTYSQLIYAYAASAAPLALMGSVLGALPVPFLSSLNYGLSVYGLVLEVIALKAVHQIGWARAIAAAFGILVLVFGVAVIVIVILALLGPAIGNIYSNIYRNI